MKDQATKAVEVATFFWPKSKGAWRPEEGRAVTDRGVVFDPYLNGYNEDRFKLLVEDIRELEALIRDLGLTAHYGEKLMESVPIPWTPHGTSSFKTVARMIGSAATASVHARFEAIYRLVESKP